MSDTVTDKQVQQSRERVDKLREQIAAERQAQAAKQGGGENEIRKAALDSEEDKLKAQLAALRAQGKTQDKAVAQAVESVSTPAPEATTEGTK